MTTDTILAAIKLFVLAADGRLCHEPEITDQGGASMVRASLVPYNKAGVSMIYVWLQADGYIARVQVAGQKVPEGGSAHGFLQVSASATDLQAEFDEVSFSGFLLSLARGMR